MNKILTILKKKAVYIPLGAVILIGGGFGIYKAFTKPEYQTAMVEQREFTQEVSVTGKVVAADDVPLGFETSGKVSGIYVAVGAEVRKGKVLASIGGGQLYGSLLAEKARLESAQIDLAEVKRGLRATELDNLKEDLEETKRDLKTEIRDAFATSDDVLRTKIDLLFNNATGPYPQIVNFGSGSKAERLEDTRVLVGKMMFIWKKSIDKSEMEGYSDTYRVEAEKNLKTMRDFLDNLAIATSYLKKEGTITDAEREVYIAAVSSGRATINTSIASLNASYQAYLTAENKLELSKEGATTEEIQRAEAAVKSAQANVLRASAALGETYIIAPFDGIVTKADLRVGQFISGGVPVMNMISKANFQIESFIPEADIAKVKIGQSGTTTLDAYGDSVSFSVVVTAIDLSDTEVDGVSTYKTTLQFSESDARIRSGMTANIDLRSEIRNDVLSIQQSAIINKEGKRTVQIFDSESKIQIREIKTGSLDANGHIEIIGGLKEGEVVVVNPSK